MPTAATTVASSSKREDEDNDDDSDDGVTERAFREVCFCSSLLRLLPLFFLFFFFFFAYYSSYLKIGVSFLFILILTSSSFPPYAWRAFGTYK